MAGRVQFIASIANTKIRSSSVSTALITEVHFFCAFINICRRDSGEENTINQCNIFGTNMLCLIESGVYTMTRTIVCLKPESIFAIADITSHCILASMCALMYLLRTLINVCIILIHNQFKQSDLVNINYFDTNTSATITAQSISSLTTTGVGSWSVLAMMFTQILTIAALINVCKCIRKMYNSYCKSTTLAIICMGN